MAKTGDDCYYYYFQNCVKGAACPFRHVEEARSSTVTCDNWRMNRCLAQPCPFRHMELQQNTPCYYETQPSGCTKPNCQFRHKFPKKSGVPPVSTAAMPPVSVAVSSQPTMNMSQPPQTSGQVPVMWNRPSSHPAWPGPQVPPPPHVFPGPPLSGPHRPGGPSFPPFHPAGPLPGSIPMMQIDPVIINPNEESDQDSIKGSPMKQTTRSVVTATTSAIPPVQSNNPLDYFLNAKPWVDPGARNVYSRSSSPGRSPPYRKQGSVSPRRSPSPRRSQSPKVEEGRRSVSAERYREGPRRRSNSLDRSRSPDWRDRRRFGRRPSRSPPRRRSRSPDRGRTVGILNHFKTGARGTKLEEVKVTGRKVISIKKDKKETEGQEDEKEKQEEQVEEKAKGKADQKAAPVIEEEVKSLEDIYRERALQSLMEAKRKKILENKRKKWEQADSKKKSESDKSDKSEKQSGEEEKQSALDEKGDNQDEVDSSSDSPDEDGNNSDLPDDIDIELGEGEIESDREGSQRSGAESEKETKSNESEEESSETVHRRTKSSISIPVKPSIKSRLGLKAVDRRETVQKSVESGTKKPSVKDRLGIKPGSDSSRPGVIRLSKNSKADDVFSRIRINRDIRERRHDNKNILLLPHITIKNPVDIEDRKTGIKQRLGLLDDEENDSDSKRDRKKKKGIDEELMKLLREEEADIDEEDLALLSKKEKKKLLKRLLVQQGREEEYEAIRKKKKRGFKKKKDRIDEEGDAGSTRRINIQRRLDKKEEINTEEDLDVDNLPSEDEIILEEGTQEAEETSQEKEVEEEESPAKETEDADEEIPVKSLEEIQKEKEEKQAKLREALEPKSLEDIRRERALKKANPGDERIKIAAGQTRRKIVIEEEEPPRPADPPVRVTFNSRDILPKRKLIRLGNRQEQDENDQPSEARSLRAVRRERQIYVPPTVKRTEGPVISTRILGPPKGREIVDYGDMFPKTSTSADAVNDKKTAIKLVTSASESDLTTRPRLKLHKGPPKVEVKDATVKTFAEIMAEKKRKRLLAQQGKPYTPIAFNEAETGSSAQTGKSVSIKDRLSPLPAEPQVTPIQTFSVSTVSSSIKVPPTLTKSASTSNVQTENKPTRWKRRKTQNTSPPPSDESDLSSQGTTFTSFRDRQLLEETEIQTKEKLPKAEESIIEKEVISQKSSPPLVKKKTSLEESKPPAEKKKRTSDSFMDFEDDILDMDDADIDLELEDGHQDADELMREIDELLS